MNDSTRVIRRPRRAWPPTARTAAAIIATAALALPAAAFGGSPSSTVAGGSSNARASALSQSTNVQQALAYARCMRSHGVPNFPDPNSSGAFPKVTLQQLGVSSSQFQAATQACRTCSRTAAAGRPRPRCSRSGTACANFARCMRSHGVPNWPDPTPYPPYPNEPTFMLPASIQPVPQTISKMEVCLRLVPNNEVVGHIDNDNWQAAQQAMAGQ